VATAPAAGDTDDRSLLFCDFLAMPLLELGDGSDERKFSGNEDVAHNVDALGRVIDAYVHHTLDDSLGDFLLVDVQGKSPTLRTNFYLVQSLIVCECRCRIQQWQLVLI
jgi:hypothetical protein